MNLEIFCERIIRRHQFSDTITSYYNNRIPISTITTTVISVVFIILNTSLPTIVRYFKRYFQLIYALFTRERFIFFYLSAGLRSYHLGFGHTYQLHAAEVMWPLRYSSVRCSRDSHWVSDLPWPR